jgi:hypothetical protein
MRRPVGWHALSLRRAWRPCDVAPLSTARPPRPALQFGRATLIVPNQQDVAVFDHVVFVLLPHQAVDFDVALAA